MTSLAMVVGMIPTAAALGEGGEQSAPLGRAVIGGLLASTVATLLFVPAFYVAFGRKGAARSPSLDPDDERAATAEGAPA
jgi:multidrug efflux pump subunit AcrB